MSAWREEVALFIPSSLDLHDLQPLYEQSTFVGSALRLRPIINANLSETQQLLILTYPSSSEGRIASRKQRHAILALWDLGRVGGGVLMGGYV